MARPGTVEVRINKRTVRIGHETYPLRNISRVQTVKLRYQKARTIFGLLKIFAGLLAAAVVVRILVEQAAADSDVIINLMGAVVDSYLINDLIGVAVLVGTVALLTRMAYVALLQPIYALAIETAGTQFRVVVSRGRDEIHRVEDAIVKAIEDPPMSEQIVHIGDVVRGDKIGRDKNIMDGGNNQWYTS